MNGQDEESSGKPAAVGQVNGESDIVAERAGVELRKTPRPIPAEPVEVPDPVQKVEEERREATEDAKGEDVRPNPEPTD